MLTMVALTAGNIVKFSYCYSGDYPTRVSGRMDIPGVNHPDIPRTPMLSGE